MTSRKARTQRGFQLESLEGRKAPSSFGHHVAVGSMHLPHHHQEIRPTEKHESTETQKPETTETEAPEIKDSAEKGHH